MKRAGIGALVTALVIVLGMRLSAQVTADGRDGRDHDDRSFSFALIGDMPYGAEGDAKFPNVIADINADRNLSFAVHDGDIKNGSSLCSDEMYFNRLDLFNQFRRPLVYVPGDNEWTDCHRANNGAYDPLERLAFLRSLFFSTERSLGRQTMRLRRQSTDPDYAAYRENVRWSTHGVLFVGLHVVGSNNNLGRTPEADAEYAERNAANLVWLQESFARARSDRSRAVMIVIQANPGFDSPASERTGFNDFLVALEAETLAFGRPVVLVHGDSHYFRIDKPMIATTSGRRVELFTRVETFGENDNHWLHVTVDRRNPNVFTFDQRIVTANLVPH
ncbi:MAG TPA: hypothetical protein VIX63_16350 [Vicinamibacterales bacterium]